MMRCLKTARFASAILIFAFSIHDSATAQVAAKAKKPGPTKIDSSGDPDGFIATPQTRIDFSETMIDGKMKAPEGFMLQGQQSNSLSQMVKLRSNFRNELNNSISATKALVK